METVVTGLGLVTPGGIGVARTWQTVCAGTSTAAHDPDLAGLPVDLSCRVPGFDPRATVGRRHWQYDRLVQFALVAAREAVADAGLDPTTWDGARVGVVIGVGMWGVTTTATQHAVLAAEGPEAVSALLLPMMLSNMAAGQVGMDLRAGGPNLVTATACASGSTAIGLAHDLLRSRTCDVVVAGGTEAGVTPLVVAGFAQMGALSRRADPTASRPFDTGRDGFVLGEGCGLLVLERAADATARGARVRARLLGFGASADAHHPTAPDPEGRGVQRAVRDALRGAGLVPADVDHVNAHATGTPAGDLAEARVLRRLLGPAPVVTASKGALGHALGAAGGIEAALTVLALQHGLVPPTANLDDQDGDIALDVVTKAPRTQHIEVALSNSFGFGGQNAVLVLAAA
ncbi:beta-ketoacyl-[acyl-carrier-protein] synthase family protein [Micromonospora echinofusca]|uniref:Beta-ketoacyl-ACP synthase II n=1 Tax=Micromonospora echinofusca TaxID=47858 RepID=A0ABS3VXT0_MICEH|nr:beta-ketoacyl-ACP synthase II [Micromonospora echinofusca]